MDGGQKFKKTALITGASTGIGKALADLLFQKNYQLILMARRGDLLDKIKSDLLAKNPDGKILCVVSDVSDFNKHQNDVSQAIQSFGSIDLLIANAGVGYTTIEMKNTWEKTKKTLDVNLLGVIATIEAGKDFMLQQGSGHIVAISSMAAVRGMPTNSAYASSKAGLRAFMESLQADLRSSTLQTTAVYPGFVWTPMTEKNSKMPWLMSADRAAQIIYNAIQKKKRRLIFPWQMKIVYWIFKVMPDWLYDGIAGFVSKRAEDFKKNRE